jgi:hypothetical protein
MKLDSAWKSIGLSCVMALFVSERYSFFDTWLMVFSVGFAVGAGLIFLNAFLEAD